LQQVRPEFVVLPASESGDILKRAAEAGRHAGVDVVLLGTVLDATVSHAHERATTWTRLPGVPIVGGSVTRTTAEVSLHLELVDAVTAQVRHSFEDR